MNNTIGECLDGPFDGAQFQEPCDSYDGDVEIKAEDVGRSEYRGMSATYVTTSIQKVDGLRTIRFYRFVPGSIKKSQ